VAAANVDKFYLTELDGLTTTNTKTLSVIKYSNTRLLTSMRYMEKGPRSAEMQDIAPQDHCTTNAVC
jgi:hypothetical protein